ncbi:MAG: stalk domain-containing protein [Acidobacteriota bacterium]
MKRAHLLVLLLSVLLCLTLVGQAVAGSKVIVLKIGDPYMSVNGASKEIDPGRGTKPLVLQGSTVIPIKAIIDEMGGTVGWDANTRQVTISASNKTIKLTLGYAKAEVQEGAGPWSTKSLPIAPQTVNGRTMVPLRFVTETLGAQVGFDSTTKTITLTVGAQAVDPMSWSGSWTTDEGTIVLKQSGNIVTGNDTGYYGQIKGTTSNGVLTGTWYISPTSKGDLEMTLTPDGKGFTSKWRYNYPGNTPDPEAEDGGWQSGATGIRI